MEFHVYRQRNGNWTWHLKGGNGQVVATANEAFASKANARRAAENVKANASSAPIVEDD